MGTSIQREGTETQRPIWFAAYTAANREKKVASQLADRAIPHYLPLYESVRQWKDRKKRLEIPLFPGYLFVRTSRCDIPRLLQVAGLVRFVGFGGCPMALPETDLAAIRLCLTQKHGIEPYPFLQLGRQVRIMRGALQGTEGILVRKKGEFRLVLSISTIMRGISVEVDITDVELAR